MVFLTPTQRAGLSKYSYHGVDDSITAKVLLQHWWRWSFETLTPRRVAANTITLLGLACVLTAWALMLCFNVDLSGTAPAWVYPLVGVLLFAYQTLDNIDGKQARATGTASPLGELFDHGCDSLGLTFIAMVLIGVGGMGQDGALPFYLTMFSQLIFYICTWEEYFTGTLYLGPFNGPDDGLFILSMGLVALGFIGPAVMLQPIGYWGLTYGQAAVLASTVGSIATIVSSVITVVRHPSSGQRLGEAAIALTPFFMLYGSVHVVLYLDDWAMWQDHPVLCMTLLAFAFAHSVVSMILHHVTRSAFRVRRTNTGIAATALVFHASVRGLGTAAALYLGVAVLAAWWIYWFAGVSVDITTELGLYVFSVDKRRPQRASSASAMSSPLSSLVMKHSRARRDTVSPTRQRAVKEERRRSA